MCVCLFVCCLGGGGVVSFVYCFLFVFFFCRTPIVSIAYFIIVFISRCTRPMLYTQARKHTQTHTRTHAHSLTHSLSEDVKDRLRGREREREREREQIKHESSDSESSGSKDTVYLLT